MKHLQTKTFCYSIVNITCRVLLTFLKVEKMDGENIDCVVLSVFLYMHNSKTKGHTRTFYISNNSSTIGDVPFLV